MFFSPLQSLTLVEVKDEAIAAALARLWRPFFNHPPDRSPSLQISITFETGVWKVDAGERGVNLLQDRWGVVNLASSEIFQGAVRRPGTPVEIHAAVIAHGSASTLLVGATGSGKTTLCIRILMSDLDLAYGSDDLAPIHDTGVVEVFAKPLVVKDPYLWNELAALEPELAQLGRPSGPFLIPADHFRLPEQSKLDPGALIFLDRRPGPPEMKELSPAEAAARCGTYVSHMSSSGLKIITNWCARSSCFGVSYASWDTVVASLGPLARKA